MPPTSAIFPLLLLLTLRNTISSIHGNQFKNGDHTVTFETYGNPGASSGLLVLLPGANGSQNSFYRDRAHFFSRRGYRVFVLHYLDATDGFASSAVSKYPIWSQALTHFVGMLIADFPRHRVGLVGYSLGASVALVGASRDLDIAALVDWYGSLPDDSALELRQMPPLLILHGAKDHTIPASNAKQLETLLLSRGLACSSHIYSDQGHGFSGAALIDAEYRTARFLAQYVR